MKKSGEAGGLALLFALESAAALVWCAVVGIALADRRAVRRLRYPGDPAALADGRVTAIVPARNEAANIDGWLQDVTQQSGGIARILVADDSSVDETVPIAQAWTQRDPRVEVVRCQPPPAGWIGKSWAAYTAALRARTDWLLFSDADMRMRPATVAAALQAARELDAAGLSVSATLECKSPLEQIIMPLIAALIFTAYPVSSINDDRRATALFWGGFILVRRDAYFLIGGHAAVRAEIAEDRGLAQRLKAFAYRIRLLNGSHFVRVRMYSSLPAMWEGWRKNFYEGVTRNPAAAALFLALNCAMLVLPWPLFGVLGLTALRRRLSKGEWRLALAAGAGCAGAFALRVLRDPLIGGRTGTVIATPLAGIFVCAVMAASAWRGLTGQGQTWKGRTIR